MAQNDFLPFCPTDTGSNLTPQATYLASTTRTGGQGYGVADPYINNKGLRQGTTIASQLAQLVANKSGVDVLDDGNYPKLLAQLTGTLLPIRVPSDYMLSGSGNYNLKYVFFISSGSATAGATYTNNGITYTVRSTVSAATQIVLSGSGAPTFSGTLTKSAGTGDATLTFFMFRAPIGIQATLIGGGGGGAGSGASPGGAGSDGSNTTFNSVIAHFGLGGPSYNTSTRGGVGGSGTGISGNVIHAQAGGTGQGSGLVPAPAGGPSIPGGSGGTSRFAGNGGGGGTVQQSPGDQNGYAAVSNTGSGGGGGGVYQGGGTTGYSGSGGGAGEYVLLYLPSPSGVYAYSIGTGGAGGVIGSNGGTGGTGASGIIIVESFY